MSIDIDRLRKEFPSHHDTKFRLLVRKKCSHEVLCDELFECYEDADRRTGSLFCYRDGKPPKYDSHDYTIDIFHPLSEYEDHDFLS